MVFLGGRPVSDWRKKNAVYTVSYTHLSQLGYAHESPGLWPGGKPSSESQVRVTSPGGPLDRTTADQFSVLPAGGQWCTFVPQSAQGYPWGSPGLVPTWSAGAGFGGVISWEMEATLPGSVANWRQLAPWPSPPKPAIVDRAPLGGNSEGAGGVAACGPADLPSFGEGARANLASS